MIGLLRRSFFENPLIGRQWATQLTGGRLGLIYLIVAGALLVSGAVTLSTILIEGPFLAFDGFAGSFLCFVNNCVVYGCLSLFLPIRLSGALDGPRMDRAFDQLVVTGLSPLRIHAGNWALAFLFALNLLLVSLPFQVYAYMLGGVSLGYLVACYAALALYANVIIGTTLGFSVVEREWLAAPATIAFFGLAGSLSCVLPQVFGCITPVRWFLPESLATEFYRGAPAIVQSDPVLFTLILPPPLYAGILWGLFLIPSVVWVLLGPAHRFVPGLNNFGNVVLPGDRKRKLLRRFRFALTRKVEVAFFYENRPRWLAAWELPLRAIVGLGIVVFLWAVIIGLCFNGTPAVRQDLDFTNDEVFGAALGFTGGVLFLALLWCADPAPRLSLEARLGRLTCSRSLLLSLCALALLGAFVALHATLLHAAAPTGSSVDVPAWQRYQSAWWSFVASLTLFLLNVHLLGKLLGPWLKAAGALRFLMCCAAFAALLGPLLIAGCIAERWLPRDFFPLVLISPLLHYLDFGSSFRREVFPPGFRLGDQGFYNVCLEAGVAALLLLLVGLRAAWSRWRRRAAAPAAALVLLLGALAVPAPAQDDAEGVPTLPLEAELIRGFEGVLYQHQLDFFTLILRNRGATSIEGKLWLDTGRSRGEARPFAAPAGTTTVVRWSQMQSGYNLWGGNLVLEAPEGRLEVAIPGLNFKGQSSTNGKPSDYLLVEDKTRSAGANTGLGDWTRTRALCLPEDPRPYAHLAAVFIGPADLSRWSAGQRRALFDYVRLGGCVIFHGGIDRGSLAGAGEWAELIEPRARPQVPGGDAAFIVEDFQDGRTLVWDDGAPGESALPLLNVRPVGLGWVGHASVPPTHEGGRTGRVQKLLDGLPRSSYPACLTEARMLIEELLDPSSMIGVGGYFLLYVLAMGPFLILGFRSKKRRRLVPLAALLIPLAFVVGIPLLHASLHLRPSRGALTRLVCIGPGARRGTSYLWLHVASTGRQRHALELEGENLSAFRVPRGDFWNYRYGRADRASPEPALLRPAASGASILNLPLLPWGSQEALVVADARLEQPVFGRAIYDSRTKKLSLQASGLEVFGTLLGGRVIARLPDSEEYSVAQLTPASIEEGALSLSLSAEDSGTGPKTKRRPSGFRVGRAILEDEWPSLLLPDRPFVYVGLLVESGAPVLRTSDIELEREVSPEPDGGWGGVPDRRRHAVVEREGRAFLSYERTLILQELPLEIR